MSADPAARLRRHVEQLAGGIGERPGEIVLVGAHYDTVQGSPERTTMRAGSLA
jgi:hypothetical protein